MTSDKTEPKAFSSTLGSRNSTFAITVTFELAEGAFAEFHRLVNKNAALSMAREPECLRFDVLTSADGPPADLILLYEIYASREAFDRHLDTEHYRNFDRLTHHLVRKKTVLTFNVMEHVKGGASL